MMNAHSAALALFLVAQSVLANCLHAQTPLPRYVEPTLFQGRCYLLNTATLSDRQQMLMKVDLGDRLQHLIYVSASNKVDDSSFSQNTNRVDSSLWSFSWENKQTVSGSVEAWSGEQRQTLEASLKSFGDRDCLLLASKAFDKASPQDRDWLTELMRGCLDRGATVVIDMYDQPDDVDSTASSARRFNAWYPVPDIAFTSSRASESDADGRLAQSACRIELGGNAVVRIRDRELVNLSEADDTPTILRLAATETYAEPIEKKVVPRSTTDLVAVRRALLERRQPAFPSSEKYQVRLEHGSLVIVGGGGATEEIWQKFIELAGGENAHIVVLPTAVPEPSSESNEARLLRRMGVRNVTVLPQIGRQEVSDERFLAQLRSATGIWFGGGRQWRFVDAYWGTPAWDEIKQVLTRGGVIAGSSAGATIQGDLLVRGSPLGNQIMVEDGYRHGLGLLPGVAIDQHFRQRNRFEDLRGVVKRFPTITGIGIDESTALIVQSPDKCEVLGEGSVWILPPNREAFVERSTGSRFLLSEVP